LIQKDYHLPEAVYQELLNKGDLNIFDYIFDYVYILVFTNLLADNNNLSLDLMNKIMDFFVTRLDMLAHRHHDMTIFKITAFIIERLALHEIEPPTTLWKSLISPSISNYQYSSVINKLGQYLPVPAKNVDNLFASYKSKLDKELLTQSEFLLDKDYDPPLNRQPYSNYKEDFYQNIWPAYQARCRSNAEMLYQIVVPKLNQTNLEKAYFERQLNSLADIGWNFGYINKYINRSSNIQEKNLINFVDHVDIFAEFKIKPNQITRMAEPGFKLMFDAIAHGYKFNFKNTISDIYPNIPKSINMLTTELTAINSNLPGINKHSFESKIYNILNIRDSWPEHYADMAYDFNNKTNLHDWNSTDYTIWHQAIGDIDSDEKIAETFAVLSHAIHQTTAPNSYFPRDAQLLAVMTMNQYDHGVLAQVATGEGKTLIVSLMAAMHAINGSSIDIVTSSSYLAHEGYKSMLSFYQLIGIGVGFNGDSSSTNNAKDCYRAPVVYGDLLTFIADHIRDIKENVKHGRALDKIII
ncbi:MAG: hypothetical protein AAF153_02650, partial [Pseudomonadota bacterium]